MLELYPVEPADRAVCRELDEEELLGAGDLQDVDRLPPGKPEGGGQHECGGRVSAGDEGIATQECDHPHGAVSIQLIGHGDCFSKHELPVSDIDPPAEL